MDGHDSIGDNVISETICGVYVLGDTYVLVVLIAITGLDMLVESVLVEMIVLVPVGSSSEGHNVVPNGVTIGGRVDASTYNVSRISGGDLVTYISIARNSCTSLEGDCIPCISMANKSDVIGSDPASCMDSKNVDKTNAIEKVMGLDNSSNASPTKDLV